MRDKIIDVLAKVDRNCTNTECAKCQYKSSPICIDEKRADAIIESGVAISDHADKDAECTASLNYEAEYARKMEEIEKAKYEIGYLRDELRNAKQALSWYEAMKQTIEVIFGRKFEHG